VLLPAQQRRGCAETGRITKGSPSDKLTLSASYKLRQWTFTAGVDNLTDRYPNRLTPATTPNTVLPYSQSSPFGFNGRFAYLKAGYSW